MSTEQQRQEWAALAAAATPGEWRFCEGGIALDNSLGSWWAPIIDAGVHSTDICYMAGERGDKVLNVDADAAFIAAARAAVPQLLADVDALAQERDALAAELEQAQAQANIEWQEEHAARLVLAEQLEAAEQRAEALRAQLAGDTPEPMLYKASNRPLWTDDAQA